MTKRDKFQIALDKTIEAYRDLIDNPEKIDQWVNYGSFRSCHLCRVASADRLSVPQACVDCPLYLDIDEWDTPCVDSTHATLREALEWEWNIPWVQIAAMARLEFIKERATRNGYKIKEHANNKKFEITAEQ